MENLETSEFDSRSAGRSSGNSINYASPSGKLCAARRHDRRN